MAEIGFVDRVARQLRRAARKRHAALLKTIDAVGDRHRLGDVLLDETRLTPPCLMRGIAA